ncbi:hypothetical protein GCM10017562_23190 [Streptomyces roseofulvus]
MEMSPSGTPPSSSPITASKTARSTPSLRGRPRRGPSPGQDADAGSPSAGAAAPGASPGPGACGPAARGRGPGSVGSPGFWPSAKDTRVASRRGGQAASAILARPATGTGGREPCGRPSADAGARMPEPEAVARGRWPVTGGRGRGR